MSSGPTIVRLARADSSAVDLDTEAGRAFLQERLALHNKLSLVISGVFFLSAEAITAPDRVNARGDLYALGAVGYYAWSEDEARAWWTRWRSRPAPPEKTP